MSQFGSISEASSGQNRISRAVFMQGDGLELTGGTWRIDFYMNEQLCKNLFSYTNFASNSTASKNLQLNTAPS